MVKHILKGYLGILSALARIVLLGGACIAGGLAIVYPLWKLATGRPGLYTLVCALLFAAVTLYIAATRMRTAFRLNPARFSRNMLKFAVLAAGLGASVALVLTWHRFLALAALLVTVAVWGLLAFSPEPPQAERK